MVQLRYSESYPGYSTVLGPSSARGTFPNPFANFYPRSIIASFPTALDFATWLWTNEGLYRQAMNRVIAFFITQPEVVSETASGEEKKTLEDFMKRKFRCDQVVTSVCGDYLATGNGLATLLQPFRRSLMCPSYRHQFAYSYMAKNEALFEFSSKRCEFVARCPSCNAKGVWHRSDINDDNLERLVLRRWPAKEIGIVEDPLTGKLTYFWKIPEYYRRRILEGDHFCVETCPWEIMQAIKNEEVFVFGNDEMFHMRDPVVAGVLNRGWGIAKVFTVFDEIVQYRLLRRAVAAIAEDYVLPYRCITPSSGRGGSQMNMPDPYTSVGASDFVENIRTMIDRKRLDPTALFALPMPIEFQVLGADATQLIPKDLIALGEDALLNALGVPSEFYRGTLSMEVAPQVLRIFQSQWVSLPQNINSFLTWVASKICKMKSWEEMPVQMQPVTHADDAAKQLAKLQMVSGDLISRTTGLRVLDVDAKEEIVRKIEEKQYEAEKMQESQEKLDKQVQAGALTQQAMPSPFAPPGGDPAQGGAPPPGGAPPGGGAPPPGGAPPGGGGAGGFPAMNPNQPYSLDQIGAAAQQYAASLDMYPDSQKRSELIKLKQVNPTLHAAVKSELEQLKRQRQQAGGEMLAQQQQQGQPAG